MTLRRAWRSLRRSPGFAAGAAATFALGIGINIAAFASVDRLLFRPLPYRDADRLFLMQQIDLDSGQRVSMPARYVVEARALGLIEDLAILGDSAGYFLTPAHDGPELRVSFVTSRMLAVGGVTPALGRGFTDADAELKRRVVILTDEAWRARFGADPGVIGRRLWLGDDSLEIVGVLPPGYIPSGTFIDLNVAGIGLMAAPGFAVANVQRTLPPTVRLKPGVSQTAAQAAIDAMVARLAPEMPPPTGGPQAVELVPIRRAMFGQYYQYLWLVIGGAALVFAIACVNLAGLFLVRSRSRIQHAAIQLSLGATTRRLVLDAMAESLLVCLAGAAAALLALALGDRWLQATVPPVFSRFSAGVDVRVVAFALAAATAAGLAASILPAVLLGRRGLWRVVQGGPAPFGAGSRGSGRWLLAVEAAVGVVLVAGAAMTARNFSRLTSTGLGFDARPLQLILARSSAPRPEDRFADLQQAIDLIRDQPGVVAASGAPMLSIVRTGTLPFAEDGPPCCRWRVTGDYAAAVGLPVLAGRAISDADVRSQALVATLNEAGLHRVWPGVPAAAAVGRTLAFEGEPAREVVGIIGNTRRGYDDDWLPGVYVPMSGAGFTGMLMVARTRPGAPLTERELRPLIQAGSRRSLTYVRPVAPMYDRFLEAPRFRAALFGTFGAVALLVAMVGLYAMTSSDVMNRRRELGVRLALGASRRAIVRLVLLDGARPVVAGIAAGLVAAFWAGSYLQAFLFRSSARDPWMLGAAAAALLVAGAVAAVRPAWRAAHVETVDVLKTP